MCPWKKNKLINEYNKKQLAKKEIKNYYYPLRNIKLLGFIDCKKKN